MNGSILIVDDDEAFAHHLRLHLSTEGYSAATGNTASRARQLMEAVRPDVVLLNLGLMDGSGTDLMLSLGKDYPDTGFIIMTGYGSIRSAVEATGRGGFDYLTKPFEIEELLIAIGNVLERQVRDEELRLLRSGSPRVIHGVGEDRTMVSPAMREVVAVAGLMAERDAHVLIEGESGTGKGYMARWIHARSCRSDGPFFSINCSALSPKQAELELFGHEPGATVGSSKRKKGLLDLSSGGTLLLNEVRGMDPALQSKLLAFLETRSIIRFGGDSRIGIDARVVAATSPDLSSETWTGRFRNHLVGRIGAVPIDLPPLRKRREDIPGLVDRFLEQLRLDMGLAQRPEVTDGALEQLSRHSWPGNLRELRNVLERALLGSREDPIKSFPLERPVRDGEWKISVAFPRHRSLHEVTSHVARAVVQEALLRSRTRQEAARLLGISRHALAYQIKTLGIDA